MTDTATQIPIDWKTPQTTADRLLGKKLRPLWDDTLALTQNLASERQWPLKRILVELEQDDEIDWEYLVLVLVFDCSRAKAEKLRDEFLNALNAIDRHLNEPEKSKFTQATHYEFDIIDPQL